MPLATIYDSSGKNQGELELKKEIFEVPVKVEHLHAAVERQLKNKRVGTACTKTRGEVRGGGKKPWRQKGTGRARHGSIRSPIWKGGGVTFGPRPRDYSMKLSKKMRRLAMREALSMKLHDGRLKILDELKLDRIKTKDFTRIIDDLKLEGRILFVLKDYDEKVAKSGRNIEGVKLVKVEGVGVYDIFYHDYVVLLKEALPHIEEVLS